MKSIEKKLRENLSTPVWYPATCKGFMINLRELLEGEDLKSAFPYLNLYCDWCAHTNISRSTVAFEMLLSLTKSICQHNIDPNSIDGGDIHKRIIDTIGILQLRQEMIQVLHRFNLPSTPIENWAIWKGIFGLIISDIQQKPIMFPSPIKNKAHQRIYDSIQEEASLKGQPKFAVIGFRFFSEGNKPMWEIFTEYLVTNAIHLVGPLSLPPAGESLQ